MLVWRRSPSASPPRGSGSAEAACATSRARAAARLAGLPDWPGFDLLATPPDGDVRSIEVKGRAGRSAIQLEPNEWKQACHLEDRYWLYVVFDCATPEPRLVRVRDPFRRLLANRRESSAWVVSARSLMDAAEPA